METKVKDNRLLERAIGIILILGLGAALWFTQSKPSIEGVAVETHFSPNGECTETIVKNLDRAKRRILVQAYSFTSAPIAKAVADAHKRGIEVVVILDKSQRTEKYSSADFLHNAGVQTFIDSSHAIAHNKIIIIDDDLVITGSFNFTKAAEERNAENFVILKSTSIASRYTQNWQNHRAHAVKYEGRGVKL